MPEKEKVYVKTVYGPTSLMELDISGYDSEEEAELVVRSALKWGIDIVSCEIVSSKGGN